MATQKIETGLIADSAVTTAKLADNSVTAAKIAAGSLDDQVKGISSSADAVAITIDSSENVGINNTQATAINNASGLGNLVVGSGSGAEGITIYSGSDSYGGLNFADATSGGGSYAGYIKFNHVDNSFGHFIGNTERMRISSGGDISFYEDTGSTAKLFWDASAESLGIGTSSPATWAGDLLQTGTQSLFGQLDTNEAAYIVNNIAYDGSNWKYITTGTASIYAQDHSDSNAHIWYTVPSGTAGTNASLNERMRIDSSGNLLVGKTATGGNTAGMQIIAGSFFSHVRDGGVVQILNRKTDDGAILQFEKDNSTVGSIGNFYGYMYVGTDDTGLLFDDDNNHIKAWNTSTNGGRDAAVDLGASSQRFKDLYLSGNVRVDAGQGIFFGGAAGAAGMTSQVLDDYEEGTWTPVHGGNNMVGDATYVKVGTLVYVKADVTSAAGSTTSSAIGGLPFTASNIHGVWYVGWTNTASGVQGGFVDDLSTNLNAINAGASTAANIQAGERLILTAVYSST